MKRLTTVIFATILLLTGCIQIEERILLRRDGSGVFTMAIDMSQLKAMMENMGMNIDDLGDENPMASLESDFESQRDELNGLEGVNNTQLTVDEKNLIISFSFDFEDVEALNRGINKVYENEENPEFRDFYSYKRNSFVRTSEFSNIREMRSSMEEDMAKEDTPLDPSVMFGDMCFRTVYEFDRKVSSVSNRDATVSPDGKTVTFKYYFFNPDHQGRSPENVIAF